MQGQSSHGHDPRLETSGDDRLDVRDDFQDTYPTDQEFPENVEKRQYSERVHNFNWLVVALLVMVALGVFVWAAYFPST